MESGCKRALRASLTSRGKFLPAYLFVLEDGKAARLTVLPQHDFVSKLQAILACSSVGVVCEEIWG